jgi:putative oxidoreductase
VRIVTLVAQVLLGLTFTVLGLNGFLQFIPAPPTFPEDARTFTGVLMKTHYVYLTSGVQVLAGVLLLVNQYVPLALVVLAAVLANILVFHITMLPQGLPLPLIVTVLWFIVAWSIRGTFAPLFLRKTHKTT